MKKRFLMIAIKFLIACIAILFILKRIHLHEVKAAFQNPHNTWFLLLAITMVIPNILLHWYRWHFLLKLIHPNIKKIDSAASYFGGLVVGFVTPGRIGEFGRSLFIKEIDKLQALGMVLIDKIYAFLPIVVGGVWSLFILISNQIGHDAFLLWPISLIALVITILSLWLGLHPGWLRTSFYNLSLFLPLKDKIKRIIHCMDHFKVSHGRQYTILSFGVYCIYILQYCFLALAFESIPYVHTFAATAATMLTKTLLPVSFADIGIREGAAIYFFMKLHAAKVTAFVSSILLFIINIVFPTCLGFLFLNRLSLSEKRGKS